MKKKNNIDLANNTAKDILFWDALRAWPAKAGYTRWIQDFNCPFILGKDILYLSTICFLQDREALRITIQTVNVFQHFLAF